MLKIWGLKKDKMEGVGHIVVGLSIEGELKPSAHYVKIKAAWYVATSDTEIMSFNYFFIPFRLKWKLSKRLKIVMPDLNDSGTLT